MSQVLIMELLKDGKWRTRVEIAEEINANPKTIIAYLVRLRKHGDIKERLSKHKRSRYSKELTEYSLKGLQP